MHFGAKNALLALNPHLGAKKWSRAVKLSFLRPKRTLVPSKALIFIGFCLEIMNLGGFRSLEVAKVNWSSLRQLETRLCHEFYNTYG